MKNKILLTSLVAIFAVGSAFAATGDSVTGQGNECAYNPLGSYTGPVSLTAQWTANPHSVAYVCGTGTGTAPGDQSIDFDDTFTYTNTTGANCTKTGYDFSTWSCKYLDGNGGTESSTLANNTTYNKDVNAKCTAQWSAHNYSVAYVCGTGTGTPATTPQSVAYASTFTTTNAITGTGNAAAFPGCSKTGYHANAWSCKYLDGANNTESSTLANNSTYNKAFNAKCTATYTANSYTVTYNCGTGTGTPGTASQPISYDATFTTTNAISGTGNAAAVSGCTKLGYHAASWTCKYLDGNGGTASSSLANNSTYNKTVNATCTLNWTANELDLTWYKEPGSNTIHDTSSCMYSEGITLPEEPTKTGYTFSGWTVGH